MGTHEGNVDTLILLQLDLRTNKVALLSVPRDLYYQGRKLSTLYRKFGRERFVEVLKEISGVPIQKYVIVDMYSFIDVINLLGGVDVELKEDLIDPTYRIKENGVWSTLYYPAGIYHLNGVEVLRIVRSRHVSSDFRRAERQQQILQALLKKAKSVYWGNLATLYQFITIILKYIDTNLSPMEILGYISRGDSIAISGSLVLSTENVLYADYENLKLQGLREEEVKESFDKGAYILLPLEDDWEFLKKYIQSFLEAH
ncbi:MAG: LCP family protein [Spirochaetes bacterium]|nr:LCP family protein [Spirochaetota bacterium]